MDGCKRGMFGEKGVYKSTTSKLTSHCRLSLPRAQLRKREPFLIEPMSS